MLEKRVALRKLTTIHLSGWIKLNILENENDVYRAGDDYIIGGGSNLLIKNKNLEFSKLSDAFSYVKLTQSSIICGGALKIQRLMGFLIENSVSSLEFMAGIPATVGGAVFMNAGASGSSVCDKILYVKAFCKDKGIVVIGRDSIDCAYRKSSLDGCIVIEAAFKYNKTDAKKVAKYIKNNIKIRLEKAHLKDTFGSVFKNPENNYAGRLLEKSGAKGLRKNSAAISYKHANYILGSSITDIDDVLFLIDEAKERVLKNFGIELEEEVKIV